MTWLLRLDWLWFNIYAGCRLTGSHMVTDAAQRLIDGSFTLRYDSVVVRLACHAPTQHLSSRPPVLALTFHHILQFTVCSVTGWMNALTAGLDTRLPGPAGCRTALPRTTAVAAQFYRTTYLVPAAACRFDGGTLPVLALRTTPAAHTPTPTAWDLWIPTYQPLYHQPYLRWRTARRLPRHGPYAVFMIIAVGSYFSTVGGWFATLPFVLARTTSLPGSCSLPFNLADTAATAYQLADAVTCQRFFFCPRYAGCYCVELVLAGPCRMTA